MLKRGEMIVEIWGIVRGCCYLLRKGSFRYLGVDVVIMRSDMVVKGEVRYSFILVVL